MALPGEGAAPSQSARPQRAAPRGGQRRTAQRELTRVERELTRAEERDAALQDAMAEAASDALRLQELTAQLVALGAEREELEARWLELAEELERV